MPKKNESNDDKIVSLLQNLLAIELWRGGLTQADIRIRLGISTNTANKMLKGVKREIQTGT